MTRFEKVITVANDCLFKDKERYDSKTMTNLFLSQISETLAMIYDEGFAETVSIVEDNQGEWIDDNDFARIEGCINLFRWKCGECCKHSTFKSKYCPNCGKEMKNAEGDLP